MRYRFCNYLLLGSLAFKTALASPDFNKVQAYLKPKTKALITSQIEGVIKASPYEEGATFKKNAVLVSFECIVQTSEHNKALAVYLAKKHIYNSNLRLAKLNSISNNELNHSLSELKQAKAELSISKHIVDNCQIKAPFNGVIVKKYIYPHESVKRGDKIIEILDNEHLIIEVIVPSDWLTWLKVGSHFKLHIFENDKTYNAIVTRVVPQIDAVSRSVKVLGHITQSKHGLIAGMSGQADFFSPTQPSKK